MRLAFLTAALALLFAAPAQAATFQVNTDVDSNTCNAITCSLRGALNAALQNGVAEDDTIQVPAGTFATPEVSLGANGSRLTVVGAGSNLTFWQPTGTNRMLSLSGGANMSLRGMTVRNGRPASGNGGNLLVTASTLLLVDVRITNGQAVSGGGIYVQGTSANALLTASASLIDHNVATGAGTGSPNPGGGGLYLEGQTNSAFATLTNTTVAFNTAFRGGAVMGASGSALTLNGATIAFNQATSPADYAGLQNASAAIAGSIIAANTAPAAGAPVQVPRNCSTAIFVTDQGGNVEDQNQCKLTAASRTTADPQLATALDLTQQPPTLSIPETSPAIDFAACGSRTTDQRGMTRPLGANCDAGAYEFDPRPDTAISGAAPPFSLSSSDAGSTFQCSLDDLAFIACATPYDPGAAPGTHKLSVRAVDAQGNIDPTPATTTFTVAAPATPTPTATPSPTPTPVVNRVVVVRETKGTIKVKLPGAKKYVNLDASRGIPVKSTVDTRHGTVELTSVPKAGAPPETAKFFDGIFKVTQSKGITILTLTETLAACPKGKASAAASKPKKRRLWGDGKGKFRTEGKYAAATVRGTKWLVEDTCAGTLTKVKQGAVDVRDKVRRKTFVVRKGKSYLAKPKR